MRHLIILLLFLSLTSATLPTNYQAYRFIEVHNQYRMNTVPPAVSMPALMWSQTLAQNSNNWATRCVWGHSNTGGVGENLYVTSVRIPDISSFNPDTPVMSWAAEKQYYNYATNTCTAGQMCGHYTQIIWSDTTSIGCAIQDCPKITNFPWSNGGIMVVCQYSSPGNIIGKRPYVQANRIVSWTLLTSSPLIKQLSSRGTGIFSVNNSGAIFKLNGGTWIQQSGSLNTIGATIDNSFWGTNISGKMYLYTNGSYQLISIPSGSSSLLQADGSTKNSAVAIDNRHFGFEYINGVWNPLNGWLSWITQGIGNDIWCIGTGGSIWRWTRSVNNWVRQPGNNFINIHVADLQNIVGTTSDGKLWRFEYGSWVQLPGAGKQITISSGKLYAVNQNGVVYRA